MGRPYSLSEFSSTVFNYCNGRHPLHFLTDTLGAEFVLDCVLITDTLQWEHESIKILCYTEVQDKQEMKG